MSPRRRKAEAEAPETDVPETEEDRDGCPRDGRFVGLYIMEGLSGCYCLISFEWCVRVQRCVSLVDDSSGVCACVCVCVAVCVCMCVCLSLW